MDTLVIDAGNTRIHWRARLGSGQVVAGSSSAASPDCPWSEKIPPETDFLKVAVSCLRADHRSALEPILNHWTSRPILWIESGAAAEVCVETEFPNRTGADRALAALAWGQSSAGKPAVLIDAGTAVTVDAVTASGVLLGGWITVGWQALNDALPNAAPELPRETSVNDDAIPWSRETTEAIGGGLNTLYCSGIAGLHSQVLEGLQGRQETEIETVLTGGDADRLVETFPGALLKPGLVLDGLEAVLSLQKSENGQG